MIKRLDRNVIPSSGVELAKRSLWNQVWRGLAMSQGSSIRIKSILRFFPFRDRPQQCGWIVRASKASRGSIVKLSLRHSHNDQSISEIMIEIGSEPCLLSLPWPLTRIPIRDLDLVVEVPPFAPSDIFLGVHRAINRDALLALAKGIGVEIGPGANPQIKPSTHTKISYLEQMPVSEWERLYGNDGKYVIDPALWGNYKIGEADNLPFPDDSLDFIFSSHVFEHLANPIGHLSHWFNKLRPGGIVLAVVPDLAGTKDALQSPSSLEEILAEFHEARWLPTIDHYKRYARHNMPNANISELFEQRRSIHVHFYTNTNMSAILREACNLIGYESFHLEHANNHKDFHFVLIKGIS